ncbi:MAG TPA: hypothetical protein VNO14_13630, partial [Blastocatellia bacterium]|nr:hypothetical protein [Blastocatellia bacterium]
MAERFAERYIYTRELHNRLNYLISEQSRAEGGRGIFDGESINIFIASDLGDRTSAAVTNQVAAEIRKAQQDILEAKGISNVALIGFFLLHEPQSFTDEQRAWLYAYLKETHTLQRGLRGARRLFDSVIFLSSQNVNAENPRGFNGLDRDRFTELAVEVTATLQATPPLVQKIVQRAPEYPPYASVGATTLYFNHEETVERYARVMASSIIDKLCEPPTDGEAASRAGRFWPETGLERERLGRALISEGDGKATVFQHIEFDPALWEYPAKGFFARLGIGYIDFLCQVPRRLSSYAIYILTTRLRKFYAVVEANSRRIQEEFFRRIEAEVDASFKNRAPAEVRKVLEALLERLDQERDRLRSSADVRYLLQVEALDANLKLERKVEGGMPDLDYYYEELEQAIANRPLTLALFSRYAYLGLIAGFLLDLLAGRVPDFVLNLGPLKYPGVPLVITLSLFILFAWLKHRRANRRYELARRFYIAAVQAIARSRAESFLRIEMDKAYRAARRSVESQMVHLDGLVERLEEMKPEIEKAVEEEGASYFHIPMIRGVLPGGMPALEREPSFHYDLDGKRDPDLRNEMRDFIQSGDSAGNPVFAEWRSIAASDEEAKARFRGSLLRFAERGYAHIRNKKPASLMKEYSSADHNARLIEELRRLGFSPLTVKRFGAENTVLLERYWVSPDLQDYEDGQVFPQIHGSSEGVPSRYAGHFRVVTLLSFPLSAVLFFRSCKEAYLARPVEERRSLHLETDRGLFDPIDDLEEEPSGQPAENPAGPVV